MQSMTNEARIYNGEKPTSSIRSLGKTRQLHALKNQTGILSHTIYKNKLKMDYRLKCKTRNEKISRRNHGNKLFDMDFSSNFLGMSP